MGSVRGKLAKRSQVAGALQHAVPEKLLVHIGDITVCFALLESTIKVLIGSLIAEHQRIGQIITAELAFKHLRALAISLYKERHGEDADFALLRDLMRRAAKLEETRNKLTHPFWGAGETPGTITRIKTTAKEKHGIRFNFQRVGADDLAKVADELKSLAGDIQSFRIKLLGSGKAINNPGRKMWGSADEAV